MTEQQRIDIVAYRIGNAVNTLDEIKEHILTSFIIQRSIACIMLAFMPFLLCWLLIK